jgi:hypothetical protein
MLPDDKVRPPPVVDDGVPPSAGGPASKTTDITTFLGKLAAGLARGRINSSDVVALVFENNGLDIDVRTKRKAHPESYPKLGELLGMIGAQCAKDKIAVERLRRITFSERHVGVEFLGEHDQLEARSYRFDISLRLVPPLATTTVAAFGPTSTDQKASRPAVGDEGRQEDRASDTTSKT